MDCGSWSLLAGWALGPFSPRWPVIDGDLAEFLAANAAVIKLLASTTTPLSSPLHLYLTRGFPLSRLSLLSSLPSPFLSFPLARLPLHIFSSAPCSSIHHLFFSPPTHPALTSFPRLIHLSAFNLSLSPCLTLPSPLFSLSSLSPPLRAAEWQYS